MSILSRKRDLVYLVFFAIHLPVVLCKLVVSTQLELTLFELTTTYRQ